MKPFFYVCLILQISINSISLTQDPHYSQNYARPIGLNPALTGTANSPRLVTKYRNQWPGLSGNFVTYHAAYDQKIEAINSGVGVMVTGDSQGDRSFETYTANLFYSFHHKISENLTFLYGTSLRVGKKSIDWSKLTFGDLIDPQTGYVTISEDDLGKRSKTYFDLSLGIAGYTKNSYFGFSAHHINRPNISVINQQERLSIRYSAHAGYNLHFFKSENNNGKLVVSPNAIFMTQNGFKKLMLGSYFKFMNFTLGAWYRDNDAVIGILGYQFKQFSVGYSYDTTISHLNNSSTKGSHEMSLGYRFRQDENAAPLPLF